MEPKSTFESSRRSVVRGIAWTAPVVAVGAAAPAFAASRRKFAITLFTTRNSGSGSSVKYEFKLTIRNDGDSSASPIITFTLDPAYGGITGQGPTPVTIPSSSTTTWTQLKSADGLSITYSNAAVLVAPGNTLRLTFEPVNTSNSVLIGANIDATVTATGYDSVILGDTRI